MEDNNFSINKNKKRNICIDFFKGCACIMVVFLHASFPGFFGNDIVEPVARAAVPFFFVVSGYYLWNNDKSVVEEKLVKRMKKIFLIAIITLLIYIPVNIVADVVFGDIDIQDFLKKYFSIKAIVKFILFNEIGLERGGGIAWYLFATLYCYLIFYLVINKFRVYKVSYFFIPILLTINIIFSSVHYYIFPVGGIKFDRIFMRNWLFEGLPFMLIGHFIARYKSRLIKKQNIFYIFGIFISLLLTCIEKYVLSLIVVSYDGAELYFFNIILVIFCILFAVKNEQSSIIPQITYVGNKLSLFIYVMHQLILYIMSFIAFHIEPPIADNLIYLWMKPFVALILVIVIGLIFNNFLFKIKNKIKSNLKY